MNRSTISSGLRGHRHLLDCYLQFYTRIVHDDDEWHRPGGRIVKILERLAGHLSHGEDRESLGIQFRIQ